MDERKTIGIPLLVVLLAGAAAAVYGTVVHRAAVNAALTRAVQAEDDLGTATRASSKVSDLRDLFAKRADKNEKMLISFIEKAASANRISLASLTIDPGTLKDASRVSRFYREIDTTVRIKQVPLRNIVLFLADVQTRDPSLKPRLLSLMPSETDRNAWDARVLISYFVFDEDKEAGATPPEKTG